MTYKPSLSFSPGRGLAALCKRFTPATSDISTGSWFRTLLIVILLIFPLLVSFVMPDTFGAAILFTALRASHAEMKILKVT